MGNLSAWSPRVLSLLRIVTAACFMLHGSMKLLQFPAAGPGGGGELPPLMLVAGLLELVGGGFVLIGLFTRPVAFVLSGLMAAAYFMAHAPQGLYPVLNQGESAVLFCWIFFYLVFAGPGPWSLDALVRKRA